MPPNSVNASDLFKNGAAGLKRARDESPSDAREAKRKADDSDEEMEIDDDDEDEAGPPAPTYSCTSRCLISFNTHLLHILFPPQSGNLSSPGPPPDIASVLYQSPRRSHRQRPVRIIPTVSAFASLSNLL